MVPRFPDFTGAAAALIARIDALLEAMSGPGDVWHVDALADAPEWAELRALAGELLFVTRKPPRRLDGAG